MSNDKLVETVARAIHADCLGEGEWANEPLPDKFREVARAAIAAYDTEAAAHIARLTSALEDARQLLERVHKVDGCYPDTSDDIYKLLPRIDATLEALRSDKGGSDGE